MLIVRCPACQTTFRARPEHLGARAGRVRCGHCYTPFNALEHLLDSPADSVIEGERTPVATAQGAAPTKNRDAGPPAVLPDTERRFADARAEGDDANAGDLDERLARALSPWDGIDASAGATGQDHDRADDAIPDETSPDPSDITAGAASNEQALTTPAPSWLPGQRPDGDRPLRWSPVRQSGSLVPTGRPLESWPTLVAQPPEPETIQPAVFPWTGASSDVPPDGQPAPDSLADPVDEHDRDPHEPIAVDPDDRPRRPVVTDRREPGFDGTSSAQVDATDVAHTPEFGHYRTRKPTGGVWLWAVMVGILLGSLAVQSVYVFRVDLARHWPQLRPMLVAACNLLACDMPLPRNARAINVTSSNLESDPGAPGSFVLHARVRNEARYLQAHPHLELTLTDGRDRPVVRRVLEPDEWLAPDAVEAGFSGRTEVEVHLPFTAPDLIQATGYRLYAFYP